MTAAEREFKHLPVLFSEVMQSLNLRSGTVFVDGTLGGGGHAEGILHRTAPDRKSVV